MHLCGYLPSLRYTLSLHIFIFSTSVVLFRDDAFGLQSTMTPLTWNRPAIWSHDVGVPPCQGWNCSLLSRACGLQDHKKERGRDGEREEESEKEREKEGERRYVRTGGG